MWYVYILVMGLALDSFLQLAEIVIENTYKEEV